MQESLENHQIETGITTNLAVLNRFKEWQKIFSKKKEGHQSYTNCLIELMDMAKVPKINNVK